MSWGDHCGSTLVELSITTDFTGILASISVPEHQAMQSAAPRAEPPIVMDSLHILEKSYVASNDNDVIIPTPQPRPVPDKTRTACGHGR